MSGEQGFPAHSLRILRSEIPQFTFRFRRKRSGRPLAERCDSRFRYRAVYLRSSQPERRRKGSFKRPFSFLHISRTGFLRPTRRWFL
jgi:hypothetical protein